MWIKNPLSSLRVDNIVLLSLGPRLMCLDISEPFLKSFACLLHMSVAHSLEGFPPLLLYWAPPCLHVSAAQAFVSPLPFASLLSSACVPHSIIPWEPFGRPHSQNSRQTPPCVFFAGNFIARKGRMNENPSPIATFPNQLCGWATPVCMRILLLLPGTKVIICRRMLLIQRRLHSMFQIFFYCNNLGKSLWRTSLPVPWNIFNYWLLGDGMILYIYCFNFLKMSLENTQNNY